MSTDSEKTDPWQSKTAVLTGASSLFALSLGLLVLVLQRGSNAGSNVLWALACTGLGGLVGFLFGIPRGSRGDNGKSSGQERAGVEGTTNPSSAASPTSLERVSDWLTTVFLGLTLTQLQEIPSKVVRAASYIAGGAGASDADRTVAAALIVYFSTVGFLGGYLLTRLFLGPALTQADQITEALRDELEKAAKGVDSSQPKGLPPTQKQMVIAQKIGAMSLKTDRAAIHDQVIAVAREYERTRSAMPPSDERTRRMETVVAKMRALAYAAQDLLPELKSSDLPGDRLACIAFLQVKPRVDYVPWLAERLPVEKPFVSYHAAVALRAAALHLEDAELPAVMSALERGRELLQGKPADTDRDKTLVAALKELSDREKKRSQAA